MDNVTSPLVMGKLQGPYGTPGSASTVAAGFLSLTNRTYYRYVFYAEVGNGARFPTETYTRGCH
jgi:hypothetical protein